MTARRLLLEARRQALPFKPLPFKPCGYRLAKRYFRWICDPFASIAGPLISYQNLASVDDCILSHR